MSNQTSEFETEVDDNHTSRKRSTERPIVVQFQGAPPSGTPPTGPRASRPDKWVHLAEDGEYAEHQIRIRLRFSDAVSVATQSGDTRAFQDGLRSIVLEHNSWLDPEQDEPTVLPPASQPCAIDNELDVALSEEAGTYKEALRAANALKDKTERKAAVLAAETAHTTRETQLRLNATTHKAERRTPPCCFWDSLSQEEILLILKAIRTNKRDRVSFLLGTKTD
jgi:hypothetical protein